MLDIPALTQCTHHMQDLVHYEIVTCDHVTEILSVEVMLTNIKHMHAIHNIHYLTGLTISYQIGNVSLSNQPHMSKC